MISEHIGSIALLRFVVCVIVLLALLTPFPAGANEMLGGRLSSADHPLAGLAARFTARQSSPLQPSVDDFAAQMDRRVPQLLDRYRIPGANMALVREGEVVWIGAYGYADLEHARHMTVDARFRVESISKSVTAWGVMHLVEQGLIDLDAPLQHYLRNWQLPASPYDEQKITIRGLLSNSAGLPLGAIGDEYAPGSALPTLRDTLTQEAKLVQEPGAGFLYSNVGFHLLELLIEEVTGRDFAEYMATEVLMPLGMHNASFAWNETLQSALPTGYDLQGNAVPPYVYPAKASGGLFADVEDVARFVRAEMIGPDNTETRVLSPESVRMLYRPTVEITGIFGVVADAYGLGHFVEARADGRPAVWHGGQGHGWMTHFHLLPETGDGLVILTNSQRSWPFMAQILADWARWGDLAPVKMSRITTATNALWALVALIVLGTLWQAYRLALELRSGWRRLAPTAKDARVVRLSQATFGVGLIAVLVWSVAQPYLFISSVFPGAANWAGLALLGVAIILLLSACCPVTRQLNEPKTG